MPFKSKAQMRWMYAAEKRGEVPKGTADRWKEHTPNLGNLPDKKVMEDAIKRRRNKMGK